MPREWDRWTDQEWLDNAGAYHAARLTATAWGSLDATKKGQALTSARGQLAAWRDNPNYPAAVYEQAVWLTTEDASNAMSDYASVSVGTGSVSVSYGRSSGSGSGKKPLWMSPLAWALLAENIAAGVWNIGRIV